MSENINVGNGRKKSLIEKTWRSLPRLLSSLRIPHSTKKTVFEPTLFVFVAFAVMVLVSYLFISKIVSEQSEAKSRALFTSAYRHVGAVSSNMETTVRRLSTEIKAKAAEGRSIEEIQEYLKTASAQLRFREDTTENRRTFQKGRFYNELEYVCLIAELSGQLLGGDDWEAPAGYDIRKQSWYARTKSGNGELVYSGPYFSECVGAFIIRLGRAFYDEEGQFIGVLSIGVRVEEVSDFFNFLRSSTGYIVLVNHDGQVVTHHNSELVGMPLKEISRGGAAVSQHFEDAAATLLFGVSTDYKGAKSVHYAERLQNNWVLFSVISDHNRRVWQVGLVLALLGTIVAGALCFLLARLYREKEEADLRSRSKSMFLAKMSHEIRTPMNVIAGLSRLIAQEKRQLSPKVLKYSVEINHAANNLLAIINDILDLSKVESGKLEIVRIPFTLSSLLEDVTNTVHTRIFDKGLQFISFVDDKLPNNLVGDVVHTRQILLNILGNAAKYTREGYVAFDVRGSKIDEKTVMISFVVRDTGVGIKKEDQTKLFTDFAQISTETNWNIEGTGLGLSISYELVNRLGGSISMVSQHGHGTTFTVSLPLEVVNDKPCAAVRDVADHHILIYEPRAIYEQSLIQTLKHLNISHERVRSIAAFNEALDENRKISLVFVASFVYDDIAKLLNSPAFAKLQIVRLCENPDEYQMSQARSLMLPINALHVANFLNNTPGELGEKSDVTMFFKIPTARLLVVDDNHPNLLVAEGLLERYGCQVDFATSGQEALQFVLQRHYDLIFMDHMMPEMDGLEATMRIRDLGKKKEHERLGTVPIVALTANAVFGMKEVFLQNGMNDFVPKPVDPVRLNEALAAWIPKHKQQSVDAQTWRSSATEDESIQISGVNSQVGIIRTGGTLDGYIRIIGTLCSELEMKTKAMEEALETDDLATYRRYVHTYKSFLATIGAMPLSATAAMLETAAQNEDRATISLHHDSFVHELREIAMSIAMALKAKEAQMGTVKVSAENIEWLHGELAALKLAIEEVDMQQIDTIMVGLFARQWTKEIKEQLEIIMQNITLYEWAEAVQLIEQLERID